MIRTLLIASLATLAATEAEPKADADPYLVYGGYPYTHGLTHGLTYGAYNPYYTHPVVTKAAVKAADGEEKAVVPLTLPYGGLYNYGYGYTGYPVVKSVAGTKTIVPTLHSGLHYYGKRSADAEPEAAADADAAADPWLTYGYSGYGHGLYRPYGYRAHYGGYLGGYGGYRSYGYGGYPYYG